MTAPTKPTTRVISMRGRKGVVPDGAIYVGRSMRFYNLPLDASPFANPYSVKGFGESALDEFREMLLQKPALVARIRDELRGKVLACWCGDFDAEEHGEPRCHAQILARVADGREP